MGENWRENKQDTRYTKTRNMNQGNMDNEPAQYWEHKEIK